MIYPEFVNDINHFTESLKADQMLLLIDGNVHKHYEALFDEYDKIIVPPGERSKSLTLIEELTETMIDMGYQKDSLLVGVGGGVVTDITGFVSAVYMRGMRLGLIPTTLLGMSDAALGGKNGVNAGGIKNCLGTIRQPEFIAVWPGFLNTLPEKEFRNGMAEIIKHALIAGDEFVGFLLDNSSDIINKDDQILREMIQRSAELKLSIVQQDEFDNDTRHLLNLGHTIGHALESVSSFSHGECVAAGMRMDAEIAKRKGLCDNSMIDLISRLLETFQLPSIIPFKAETLKEKIAGDKKKRENHIRYILPVSPGDCRMIKMDESELYTHLKHLENG